MQHTQEILISDDKTRSIPVEFFNQLRQQDLLLDVIIISKENNELPAHRLVLSAQFPNIKSNLLHSQRPTVKWSRFSSDIVRSVIDFAYTGEIRINCDNVARLCLLAHNLGSQNLIDVCCEFIYSRLDQLNLTEVWSIGNLLANNNLIQRCIPKIAPKFGSSLSNEISLLHTHERSLKAILESGWLRATSEETKLKVIALWMNAPSSFTERKFREEHFISLLSIINVNKLSRAILFETAMDETDIVLTDRMRRTLLEECKNAEKSVKRSKLEGIFVCGVEDGNKGILTSISNLPSSDNPRYPLPHYPNESIVATNGFIYITGGLNKKNSSSSRVYRINPFNGEANIMKPMLFHRSSHSTVACESEVLVFGGYDTAGGTILNTCEKYNFLLDVWVEVPVMPTARWGTSALHVPGYGEVVVDGSAGGGTSLNTVELLQIGTLVNENDRTWRTLAPMLYPRCYPAIEFFEGSVYVAGDFNTRISDQTAEILSLCGEQPGQWTLIPHCESIGSHPSSMLRKGGCLLVSTAESGSIYELKRSHSGDMENGGYYDWKSRFEVRNVERLKLLKIQ